MRLADFILHDMETILENWEAFASTRLPAASDMTSPALRDHARQILEAVAGDLSTLQTKEAQVDKSMGRAPKLIDAPQTAAQTHGFLRAQSGFDINQLASEFRALRASVLRLWTEASQPEAPHLEDIIRFNEAIDQALAESISFFSAQAERARNLLLGIIGHDLRSPLQVIQMTAEQLATLDAGKPVSDAASRLIRSGIRIKALLDDLSFFNRIKLGVGIHIAPSNVDLTTLFADELELLRAAHPDRRLELEVAGDTQGLWDGLSLQRLLGNLVVNAIKYGAPGTPVRVVVTGEESDVRFEVRNAGTAIEQSTLDQIFDPLKRGQEHENRYIAQGSLGLGLYIAREIAKAHGGEIEARSDKKETMFVVRLPRHQKGS